MNILEDPRYTQLFPHNDDWQELGIGAEVTDVWKPDPTTLEHNNGIGVREESESLAVVRPIPGRTYTIHLTNYEIVYGVQRSYVDCGVAISLRAMFPGCSISVGDRGILVGGSYALLPGSAVRWIKRFDRKRNCFWRSKKMYPLSFKVTFC